MILDADDEIPTYCIQEKVTTFYNREMYLRVSGERSKKPHKPLILSDIEHVSHIFSINLEKFQEIFLL